MHIPDSAISPVTSLAAGTAMMPVWFASARRLRSSMGDRQVPLLAIGAAFCFTIMMFNIPVPGGTTVHPTGAVLLSILLGPAAAIIGMTVALAIQALFFGDGGILALGANAFTMAFAMPLCGYAAYRLLAGRSPQTSIRRSFAAGAGAYIGLNIAALLTAVILGIQPALSHNADGHALYFPFGLGVTIPAILSAHLLVAGFAEAVVTAAAIRYVSAIGIRIYDASTRANEFRPGRSRYELLWVALGAFAALSPIGLLAKGEAWGEWGAEDIKQKVGYLPAGLERVEQHGWKGFNLLPDYLSDHGKLAYVGAAAAGIAMISVCVFVVGRLLRKTDNGDSDGGVGKGQPEKSAVQESRLPAWMLTDDSQPTGDSQQEKTGADYLNKTLAGIAGSGHEAMFAERWARHNGLLQRLDPRAKIAAFLGFILLTAFLHKPLVLICLYAFALVLARLSGIPALLMIRRVWLAVPLFAGMVTLPAIVNVVTPGKPLMVLMHSPYLAITQPGLASASVLTFRIGTAVTFATLLTLTTRWNDLLRGMRVLFVPQVFLTIAAMTYRYIAVLLQSASEMFTARKSRSIGGGARGNRTFVGNAIGGLFGKTLALTDEVHAAMLSRGWKGEARALEPLRLQATDGLWFAAMCVVAVIAAVGETLA